MFTKKTVLILAIIFLIGFYLRVLYLPKLALIFGYDQARDAFISQQIIDGDLKIIGPSSSTPGLYHGVFYYYFLAPAYFVGDGNPITAGYWVALFNSLNVLIIYILTFTLTKKSLPALIGSGLFAVSYEATQYATWLSNPTLGVWTVPLTYLGLWLWVSDEKKQRMKYSPILTGVGLGLSIQSEIFLGYHALILLIWVFVSRKNIYKKDLLLFALSFFVSIFTMIAVEFKFGFRGIKGFLSIFGVGSGDQIISQKGFGDFLVHYLNQLGGMFSNSIFPSNVGYGAALGYFFIFYLLIADKKYYFKNQKVIIFLFSYLFSHITVVSFGGVSTPFLTVGLGSALIIIASIALWRISLKNRLLSFFIISLITVSGLLTILTKNQKGQQIFAIQNDMILAKELAAVDYTYQQSVDSDFALNTLTSPLWVNTTWSYLYNWYGSEKYGYMPEWYGRDQVGQLGNNFPAKKDSTNIIYFIREPSQGIIGYLVDQEISAENSRSKVLETKIIDEITVEKRILK